MAKTVYIFHPTFLYRVTAGYTLLQYIRFEIFFQKRGVKYKMNIISNDLGLILKIILECSLENQSSKNMSFNPEIIEKTLVSS